jgi:N-methylhydantoinase B
MNVQSAASLKSAAQPKHPWPTAPKSRKPVAVDPCRAADRRRHAQFDRGRDRIRDRAHRAQPDDPRGARLSRRFVRPLFAQAHRPLLFGDAAGGAARLPAIDHAAGRRLPDERHLSDRRLHRPSARPVRPCRFFTTAKSSPYIQAFGHHDDIGGRVPGSMPGTAQSPCSRKASRCRRSALQRGRAERGSLQDHPPQHARAGNSLRRPRQRNPGLHHGRAAHGRTVPALRRETVEACFQSIIEKCRDTFRNELMPKIADGEYKWHDYVERDVGGRDQAAQDRAEDDQDAGRWCSTSPAPTRSPTVRSTGRPTMPTASF